MEGSKALQWALIGLMLANLAATFFTSSAIVQQLGSTHSELEEVKARIDMVRKLVSPGSASSADTTKTPEKAK